MDSCELIVVPWDVMPAAYVVGPGARLVVVPRGSKATAWALSCLVKAGVLGNAKARAGSTP